MINKIKADTLIQYYRSMSGKDLNVFSWQVDAFFKLPIATILNMVRSNGYYSLIIME